MKLYKRLISAALAASVMFTCVSFRVTSVYAAPSVSAGWNETLYAEWLDSDPDAANVKVGYKLSDDADYTYLSGADLEYLVRPSATPGYGRVDIPGLKQGRYDIVITASDGTEHKREKIQVYGYDRSGYAHWTKEGGNGGYNGVGAYNNDGTLKDNAIVVYITEQNKNTVEIPGYEGHEDVAYASSTSGASWTRGTKGVGNILNNNHKFLREVTGTDNHPVVFRIVGEVTAPENLTPYNQKTNELGGSKGDNGNMAISKYAKNITIEGIGADATINGWGISFSQTSTTQAAAPDAGESFEVRNLTFKNYPEDALGFQGDDAVTSPIRRVWVHNNVFYPGYCANPAESDKAEGDGSLDFKRGCYYTMAYNHYINCHKTNLLGAGDSNDQFYMTLHHNWYQNVESRQPLAAGGNAHIYSTYFDNAGSTTIDLRGKAMEFSEENYFENAKNAYKTRKTTSNLKTYNDILAGKSTIGDIKGSFVQATSRDQEGLPDNGLTFPDGTSLANWDINPSQFYYNASAKKSDVEVLTPAAEVPEYVKAYAGTLKAFPTTESGTVNITVKSGGTAVKDANVTANGLNFKNNGDGTYSAIAQIGAEYVITASKEGYSNQSVTSTVMEKDGDVFNYTFDLPVDHDGYAVVKLTGGSDDTPVTGATVKLADGTVLEEKGSGVYQSAAQLAVNTYKANITNTGDYIAPESVDVNVKTTDAATEIHLDKVQGAVSVKLSAAVGETETMGTAKATVFIGKTALENKGNGVFTGNVDVNTPYEVFVNVPGWELISLSSNTVTAKAGETANVEAQFSYKGQLYTWNYTEGTNTDDFFVVSAISDWSSASKNPQEFEGETLTKAIKMNSSTTFTFDAPSDGTLTLVMDAKDGSSVYLKNGETEVSYPVATGITTIPVTAGVNVLKKNKNESHMYLVQFAGANEPDPAPTLSDEIMWDTSDTLEGESNGMTFGEKMASNSEEAGPRIFVEDGVEYELENWVQGSNDPKNASGVGPQSLTTEDRIPATGAFVKFVPEKNGVLTAAFKTNAGKVTYFTDGDGMTIDSVGDAEASTSYEIHRYTVKKGKTYYLYSAGSKICIYYLGFSGDGTVDPDPVPADDVKYGDTDCNGKVEAADATLVLQYVLNKNAVTISEQGMKNIKVTKNGVIDANTSALILQKALVSTFKFEVEE